MSNFENYWHLHGIRHEAGDHKERAKHAYEAGLKDATTVKPVDWLAELDEREEDVTP